MNENKNILFLCSGNICRSPMAKIILEQILVERSIMNKNVDSAAIDSPSGNSAHETAQKVIEEGYGTNLLANHLPKSISDINLEDYDLILTMTESQKAKIPNSLTVREIAGMSGNVIDPFDQSIEKYRNCRDELETCLKNGLDNILSRI